MDRQQGRHMDTTQEEELIRALSKIKLASDPLDSNSFGSLDPNYGAVPPLATDQISKLTVSRLDSNINGTTYTNISAIGGPSYTIGTGINTAGHVWTTTGTGTSPYWGAGSGGKVVIQGENADLVIGDKSMRDWMKQIEERLNLLTPNTKLEEEWEELRALGEQYRKLEQHIKDKQATWDRLKAMPPPVVD